MEWFRIETSTIRSPDYVGASPTQRATWLSLLNYCVEQEESGIVEGCLDWGDRRWLQACGVTASEVNDLCNLWEFIGTNLEVGYYPMTDQNKCIALRKRAKTAGLASAKARAEAKGQPSAAPNGQPNGQPNGSTEERRGEETRGDRTIPDKITGKDQNGKELTYTDMITIIDRMVYLLVNNEENSIKNQSHFKAMVNEYGYQAVLSHSKALFEKLEPEHSGYKKVFVDDLYRSLVDSNIDTTPTKPKAAELAKKWMHQEGDPDWFMVDHLEEISDTLEARIREEYAYDHDTTIPDGNPSFMRFWYSFNPRNSEIRELIKTELITFYMEQETKQVSA